MASFASRSLSARLATSTLTATSRTSIARTALRPLALPSPRSFVSARPARKDASSGGIVDESIVARYPSKRDVESPEGKDQGRHKRRTLASFSMEGKVCVVTGGARGLGSVMASALIESGCSQLAILDLRQEDAQRAADEMKAWFKSQSGGKLADDEPLDIIGVGCNVADEGSVQKAMKQVKDEFGSIHAVINSAGIVENWPASEYPTDRMKMLYDININGSYYVAREAYKHMHADGVRGSIILIASMSGSIVNIPQAQTPYNVSKAAVKHMASSMAVEWAKEGIRVNSISPGYMLTSLTQTMFDKNKEGAALKATWEGMIPQGRMGSPDDLKGAAVYLASDASLYVTAADLIVDGGYVAV